MNGVATVRCTLRALIARRPESSCSAVGDQLQYATMLCRDSCSVVVQVRGSVLRAHITQRDRHDVSRSASLR